MWFVRKVRNEEEYSAKQEGWQVKSQLIKFENDISTFNLS